MIPSEGKDMSLNLVSPGVKVREVDLTIGRVDAIQEQVGAIAGPFEKGPVNTPILIETEQDLLKTFGKPLETDAQYEYWMAASSYLSYGGVLKVVRSDDSTLNNATDSGDTTTKIENFDDYTNNHQTDSGFAFAAKNPGTWANNLKVCTIDAFADQSFKLAGFSTNTNTIDDNLVGLGVTQSLTGRVEVNAGGTHTYTGGYLRGVVTGIDTSKSEVYVKVTDKVNESGVSTAISYSQGGISDFLTPTNSVTTTTHSEVTGVVTATGSVNEIFDASISVDGADGLGIAIGDVVTNDFAPIVVAADTKVVAIGTDTISVDKALAINEANLVGLGTTAFTFTRTATASTSTYTNTNKINYVSGVGGTVTGVGITEGTVADWYDDQTLGLDNATIYWRQIAQRPATSQFASERSATNDEIHVVVVDDEGSVTGVSGNIVEKHLSLSKALDGKISPSENVYYKDYLAVSSDYVYAGYGVTAVASGISTLTGDGFSLKPAGNWGTNAQGNAFSVQGSKTYKFSGGKNYSGTAGDGYAAELGGIVSGYKKFESEANQTINFLINGPSGATVNDSKAKAKELIAIAEKRKDCIAVISPHKTDVVNVSDSDSQTNAIVNFFDPIGNSSYAVFDTGYKYVYDRFNNKFRYIACNADIAGLMARTSINQYSWFSPAGTARGTINSAIKLAYNPTQAQRDIIYPKGINPVVFQAGSGIILFGDRTSLKYASAFDRINVRRLFLTIEGTIERAARSQLFEFNDVITRSNFLNIVEPYLRDVKSKRGITDFIVVCDETNNTPDIIDSNQFRADIFVKPARSINFIGLTFVATRTGVSFEEVVGNV